MNNKLKLLCFKYLSEPPVELSFTQITKVTSTLGR